MVPLLVSRLFRKVRKVVVQVLCTHENVVVELTRRAVRGPSSILSLLCLFNSAVTNYPNTLPNPNPSHCALSLKLPSSLLTVPPALNCTSSRSPPQSKRAWEKLIRDYETWLSLSLRIKSRIKSHHSQQGPAFSGLALSSHSLHGSHATSTFPVLLSTELVSTLGPWHVLFPHLE